MKAIMISIKPKWVAKILNGEKTIEIRKTCPKQLRGDTPVQPEPIDVYIYCTKDAKNGLYWVNNWVCVNQEQTIPSIRNGKVVAKFTLSKVEEIKNNLAMRFFTESANEKELLEKSCLDSDQLFWYLAPQELKVKCCGYAWHISNLEIFDKPKELNEFEKPKWNKCGIKDKNGLYQCHKCPYGEELNYGGICHYGSLTRSPESWCYVEVE